MKFRSKFELLHWRKLHLKCRLPKGRLFCSCFYVLNSLMMVVATWCCSIHANNWITRRTYQYQNSLIFISAKSAIDKSNVWQHTLPTRRPISMTPDVKYLLLLFPNTKLQEIVYRSAWPVNGLNGQVSENNYHQRPLTLTIVWPSLWHGWVIMSIISEWDVITYHCPNFKLKRRFSQTAVKVRAWMSNYTPLK